MWWVVEIESDEFHVVQHKDFIDYVANDERVCVPNIVYLDRAKMVVYNSLDGSKPDESDWKC